jgi:hypothetical protein
MKFCQVPRLVWRNQDVTTAFLLLDEHRDRKQAGKTTTRYGVQPRVRRRPESPKDSSLGPPLGLPKDAYDKDWLAAQDPEDVKKMKIKSTLVNMTGVLNKLNQSLG